MKNEQSTNKKNRDHTLKILSIASFLHDLGGDLVFSLWPVFVTQVLGVNMTVLGFIDGLGDAVVSISQAVSGYISDRIRKRKVFVWLGYLFGGVARVGYAFAPVWYWLIPFRIMDRSGKMRSSPRDAIIADISLNNDKGRNFGLLKMMDNAGAVVGISLGILLINYIDIRILFLLAAAPSLLGVFLIFRGIQEPKESGKVKIDGISFRNFSTSMYLYTFASAVFALGSFSYSFLIIFANNLNLSIVATPVLYLIFNAVASIFSMPMGKLCDAFGSKKILVASYFFWMMMILTMLFFANYVGIILAFVLYGIHKAAMDTSQKSLLTDLSPKGFIASSMGAYQLVIGLCAFPASIMAGYLWDNVGSEFTFTVSIFLTMLALLFLIMVKEDSLQSKSRVARGSSK